MPSPRRQSSIFRSVAVILLLSLVCACGGGGLDEVETVADKFLRAAVANDMADLQATVDPDCQEDVLNAIFLQMGLSALVGGAEAEYVELQVQTTANDGQRATVHAEGKLQTKALGTQVIVPLNTDLPLVKKSGRWYVACAAGNTTVSASPAAAGEQIVENWKFVVLDTGKLDFYGSSNGPHEGYSFYGILLSVENIGPELATLSLFQSAEIYCEDGRGFTYQLGYRQMSDSVVPSEFPDYALVPPGYRIHGWIACEVASTASGLNLFINYASRAGRSEAQFDLEKTVPQSLRFPAEAPTFQSLGTPLTQEGVLTITPLRVLLYPQESNDFRWWQLFVEVRVENLYGYNYGTQGVELQVFDGEGHVFRGYDSLYFPPESVEAANGDLRDIPPGLSATGFFAAPVSESTYETGEWPEQPHGFKLLIYIPSPNGPVKAAPTYGIYDLGEPTMIQE